MRLTFRARAKEALAMGDDVDRMLDNGLLEDCASWSWSMIDTRTFLETLMREPAGR